LDCTIKALTQMTGVDSSAPVILFFSSEDLALPVVKLSQLSQNRVPFDTRL
jgi:hypothetical protein